MILEEDLPNPSLLYSYLSVDFIITFFFLLILLLLSAIASGSEASFFSFTEKDIEKLQNSTNSKDKKILFLLKKPKLFLATILIFNNLINIIFIIVSTTLVWKYFNRDHIFTLFLFPILVTFIIYLFGETLPKILATLKYHTFAQFTLPLLYIVHKIFFPISKLLTFFIVIIENKISFKRGISKKEVDSAIDITISHQKKRNKILERTLDFVNKKAKNIMVSRTDIFALSLDTSFEKVIEDIESKHHSRIPIFSKSIDKIEGILYAKDLIPHFSKKNFNWQSKIREYIFFIPENKSIQELLRDFQEKKVHLAIVVNEFAGVSGLVTMEDVLEELIGEIHDEFDKEENLFKKLKNNTYWFNPKVSIYEFCEIISFPINTFEEFIKENQSLSGLLLELFKYLPQKGEQIEFKNITFIIKEVTERKMKQVIVKIDESKK